MKKSLIAMAALAATGAFAQSSVTLYGIVEAGVDVGYNRVIERSTTTTTAGVAGVTTTTRNETKNGMRVQDGNDQGTGTSRVGFRGTEDLGGGMKANFQLEMGLRLDDGAITGGQAAAPSSGNSGGNAFGRNAWGGVSGGFGEFRIGRQVLGSFGVQGNSWAAGSSNGLYDAGAGTAPFMGGVRFSNAIRYMSPNLSGFTGSIMLAAPETEAVTASTTTVGAATTVSTTAKRRTGVDLALEYANGPAYVGLGYNLRDTGNESTTLTTASTAAQTAPTATAILLVPAGKVTAWTLGGSYDLGVAKPFINYTRQTTSGFSTTVAGTENLNETIRAWSIGVRAPVGAFTIIAGYGNAKHSSTGSATFNTNTSTQEAKRNAFQLGAQYALSKRTSLQANYGFNRLENTVTDTVGTAVTTAPGKDRISALNVGLKHSF